MAELHRNFHVLHRSGYVGTDVPREKPMMNTETLLPPAANAGAECPSGGQCDLCPLSGKCVKLHELRTYADKHEMLLPAMYNVVTLPQAGPGAQGGDYDDDNRLLPFGVE